MNFSEVRPYDGPSPKSSRANFKSVRALTGLSNSGVGCSTGLGVAHSLGAGFGYHCTLALSREFLPLSPCDSRPPNCEAGHL